MYKIVQENKLNYHINMVKAYRIPIQFPDLIFYTHLKYHAAFSIAS